MNTTIEEKYKAQADELSARIARLSVVSQDTACREGFNLEALRRAQGAAETNKVFLSGQGVSGVLIVGISALGPEKAERFIAACGGWKSHANWALLSLDGEKGEIRRNKAGTCWVIDLESLRGTTLFGWTASKDFKRWTGVRYAGPKLNTTNGAGHWCGVTSESVIAGREEANPHSVEFIRQATACWNEHGMTPRQWHDSESKRREAERKRYEEVVRAAAKAGEADGVVVCLGFGYNPTRGGEYIAIAEELAGATGPVPEDLADQVRVRFAAKQKVKEEARLMAELEAEHARLSAEKAAAEAEAKRQTDIAATCRAAGISPGKWETMTEKQRRIALHNARLAGRI
jgi:hypothetical protein